MDLHSPSREEKLTEFNGSSSLKYFDKKQYEMAKPQVTKVATEYIMKNFK